MSRIRWKMETQKIILAPSPSSRPSHPINIDIDGKALHKRRNIKDIPTTAVPAKSSSTTTTTAVVEHGTKPIYIRQHHHYVKSKRSNSWQHQQQQQQQHQVQQQQQQQTRSSSHHHGATDAIATRWQLQNAIFESLKTNLLTAKQRLMLKVFGEFCNFWKSHATESNTSNKSGPMKALSELGYLGRG